MKNKKSKIYEAVGEKKGIFIRKQDNKIRRRVVCVFGGFDEDSEDFVLEPACSDTCKCQQCRKAFWIEGESQAKRVNHGRYKNASKKTRSTLEKKDKRR
jgi:hypothetical protein